MVSLNSYILDCQRFFSLRLRYYSFVFWLPFLWMRSQLSVCGPFDSKCMFVFWESVDCLNLWNHVLQWVYKDFSENDLDKHGLPLPILSRDCFQLHIWLGVFFELYITHEFLTQTHVWIGLWVDSWQDTDLLYPEISKQFSLAFQRAGFFFSFLIYLSLITFESLVFT